MKSKHSKAPAERVVKDIRRATRKQYSAEENIRIVLEGLRGDDSIADLCRQEGISQGIYCKWSKDFMEAGKRRLAGDTSRAANSDEVRDLRREARDLKEVVASNDHINDVAQSQGHDPDCFGRLVWLACLAPDIIVAILEGNQPATLTRQRLARVGKIPLSWVSQRELLGFALAK